MMASWIKWLLRSLQVVFLLRIQYHSSEAVILKPEQLDAVVGRWNVNITCELETTEWPQNNASDLLFTYQIGSDKTKDVPLAYVTTINDRSIEVSHFPEIDANLGAIKYVNCEMRGTQKNADITVKKRHENPKIKNVTVKNWEKLIFSWETKHDNTMHAMDYEAWYWNSSEDALPMKCNISNSNASTVSSPFQLANTDHLLTVKVNGSSKTPDSKGILETVTSDEVRVNLTEYLVPNKVELINVTQHQSNKTLVFKPPKTNRSISYKINVTCSKHSFTKAMKITRLVTDSDNATNADKNARKILEPLDGLPPYSNCIVSVRAISVYGGHWSEWAHHNFQTLQDVPITAPRSCPSCFQVMEKGMNALFDAIVYFTPLSEEEARGRVERYRIRKIENDIVASVMELSPDPKYSSSFLLSNLSNGSNYKISIEAKTMNGYNETLNLSSIIRVPGSKYRTHSVSHKFTVVILNDTAVRTIWKMEEMSGIEKIFLFWCKGNVENYRPCENPLKWKEFSIAFTTTAFNFIYITKLDKGEPSNDFIFGTGIERNGKSSGITWNSCTYDIREIPPKPRIESFQSSSSGISISLSKPSCQNISPGRGFVIGYRVFLCPVPSAGSTEDRRCLEDLKRLDFNGSHEVLNLNDLRPNQAYLVLIQSLSETSTSGNETLNVTTSAGEISVVIAIVVVVVVAFVVVIVVAMALVQVKGKPLWRYMKDARTVGIIVIPPAAKLTNVDSGERTAEDEGYRSNASSRSENEEMVVAAPHLSCNSGNISDVSATDTYSARTSAPPGRSFDFLSPANSSSDMLVAVDAPARFDGPVTVDAPIVFKDPLTADISLVFNGLVTFDEPVAFNGAVTVVDSGAFIGPVAKDFSVASEAPTAVEVAVNVNAAFSVSPSVCVDIRSLEPAKSYTSVESSSERILPSLFNDSAKMSVGSSISAFKSGILEDEARNHKMQQHQEPASKVIPSICDSFVSDQCYIADATNQSASDQFVRENPLNHDEGYVCGSQRVCNVFLPVPLEPAQPVMLDSTSEFSNDGLAAEDAVPSLQTDLYKGSDTRNEDTSIGTGYHCSEELLSRSANFTCKDTQNDSDYPPMRIIEVDFYDSSGRHEKEPLADDVTISNDVIITSDDVTISTDSQMPDDVIVSTGDIISTDVIASHDVKKISDDVVLKKRTHCSAKGILSLCQDYNPAEAVDEDCVYSTVVDVNVSSRKLGLVDPILPVPGGSDDGYYSGVRVLGSLSSSPRSLASGGSEDGCWPLLDDIHDQRRAEWSVSPVSLSHSSSALPWPLHQQPTDTDPFSSARVLPSILPPCV